MLRKPDKIIVGYLIVAPLFFLVIGYHWFAISFCAGAIIGILLGHCQLDKPNTTSGRELTNEGQM